MSVRTCICCPVRNVRQVFPFLPAVLLLMEAPPAALLMTTALPMEAPPAALPTVILTASATVILTIPGRSNARNASIPEALTVQPAAVTAGNMFMIIPLPTIPEACPAPEAARHGKTAINATAAENRRVPDAEAAAGNN